MNAAQISHYQNKLSFEMDPSDLFQALGDQENIVVIDTRQPHGYAREHIPGAINLPHRLMNAETTRHLDKSKIYVCYCDGIGCNASTKGALNMAKLGFEVRELIGGISWWKFDGYATEGTAAAPGNTIQCTC
jgi:rhodanese-related sulfurtransferase